MKFSGRLQTGDDPREWLRTDLSLIGGRIELVSGEDLLGSWSTSQVKAERISGDRFKLHLGADVAFFAADDALAFSYDALPQLNRSPLMSAASGLRGMIRDVRRSLTAPEPVEAPAPSAPTVFEVRPYNPDAAMTEGAEPPPVVHRLRELIEAARRNQPGTEVVPVRLADDLDDLPVSIVRNNPQEDVAFTPLAEDVEALVLAEPAGEPDQPGSRSSVAFAPARVVKFPGRFDPPHFPQGLRTLATEPTGVYEAFDGQAVDLRPILEAAEAIVDQARNGMITTGQVETVARLLTAVSDIIGAGRGGRLATR
ncbi:MAG: hypothetical protein ACT4OP_11840 [Actinomycetota bacterium]